MSAHLACVDICQELVHFNERFLLLRVFDLVGDPKVDSESKVPERESKLQTDLRGNEKNLK